MEWMLLPLRRYFEFNGRSRRKEFWMFVVLGLILGVAAGIVDRLLGYGHATTVVAPGRYSASYNDTGPIAALVTLALFIPNLSVQFRRLHDTGRSAWWLLLLFVPILGWIVLLVFYCLDGTTGPNRFGRDPKSADLAEVFR